MARKKKPLPLLENILITDIAAEGKALAKVDGLAVFVPYVVPGDVVDIQLRRKKHSYAEGEAVKFHQLSDRRAQPFCKHYGVCGGCKWQVLPYAEQIRYKQKQVMDHLQRIGKVDLPECRPILGSRQDREYRNKLEFGFSNKKWLTLEQVKSDEKFDQMNALGFHIPGAFDKILDIDECFLMQDINNRIRNGLRAFVLERGFDFYDLRGNRGLLRNIMLRTASTGEVMLLVQFCITSDSEREQALEVMDFLHREFPEITALLYVNNTKCNDTIGDLDVITYAGTDFIYEQMEGLRFKVGPKSFYQTNSEQAYELYKVTRDFAGLTGNELVYDLYTGTGTIANFVAQKARFVVGIEYVPEAIADAKVNAALNGLDKKTLFYAGDMKDILTDAFIDEHGRPDVIITDPPRAGMHADVVGVILNAAPKRIVYVSCNPATQARDLQLLDAKYRVVAVQPVDMFPQTHHVENVVLLELKTP
ncbi:RNA methyltransferase [Tannerella sp. oral taxon BU063 isolate Cell 5]|uniref:RNA methyltransferase n=1 Tax=Tannerella sp. oral taxon BU063 isolate Cell 5 TaxID=1410950 RepID=W2CG62_9BACT|nr:RNA methyltransferase [Tannerella sp. oral taxon BU063 isolate Cell 5]